MSERMLTADLWLQLEPGTPSYQARLRVARLTARYPRKRIPGAYLARIRVTLPAAIFELEGCAELSLDPGQLAGPPAVEQLPSGDVSDYTDED